MSPSKDVDFTWFNENPLKMMKNAYFILEAVFVLKVLTFLNWFFDYVEKRLDKKARKNFKIYGVSNWITNNYSKYIARYLKK